MRKKTIEEYIETIYVLEKKEGRACTGKIAAELNVKPPSVTQMLGKLEDRGLVKREHYGGSRLTPSGKKIAKDLMKRHEVIAEFLQILGVASDLAEVDACQIEHHVNLETMDRLEKFVDFVQSAPCTPKWIQHFKEFYETGKRMKCEHMDKECLGQSQ